MYTVSQKVALVCADITFKIISVLFVLCLLCITCHADEYSYSTENNDKIGWNEFVSSLPDEVSEELEELTPGEPISFGTVLREKVSISYWWDKITEEFKIAISKIFEPLVAILCIVLLNAVAAVIIPDVPQICEVFEICVKLTSAAIIVESISDVISEMYIHMSRLCTMMNLFLPVMEAVTIAGGNITENTVNSAALTLAITLIGNFNTYMMTPLVTAMFSLSVISSLFRDMSLTGAVSAFRKFVSRIWQIGTILFSFILGMQSILAKGVDDLAARGAKFAIGSFIPVAGGMLSESFNTVREGMNYMREVCGIGGILVMLLLTIPFLVPLFIYKSGFYVSKTAAELLKCNGLSQLLEECSGVTDMIIGIVVSVELMFLFSIMIFVKCR